MERLDQIALAPAALLFGFLIGLYPILAIVSNIVSKPLKELGVAMKRFEKGDFEQKVAVTTGGEVGEVAAGFNQMVDAIKKLIDTNYVMTLQEKESELRALQAQINPHFLYNTLDSISWMCEQGKNAEAVLMVNALARLFRISISRGHELIPIRSEVQHAQSYLQIQSVRYKDQFSYEFDVEEGCLEYLCNKITLQPIIAPDDATVKNLTWVSSDEQTATVSRTGIVTALSVGETTITATTVDGGYSAEIKIIVTAAAQLGEGFRVALSVSDEWEKVGNSSLCTTACILVRKGFAEENPRAVEKFLADFAESAAWVNENVDDAAAACGQYEIVKEPIAKKAIPQCNIVCITGSEMKDALGGCLNVLFEQNPAAVGGALPDDAFYYGA